MMTSSRILGAFAALATIGAAVPAFAQPQQVTPVEVTAKAPTSITLDLRGKDAGAVYHEIRIAADTVCGNAVINDELSFVDRQWCNDTTRAKAVRTYESGSQTPFFADSGLIRLSAR